MSAPSLVSCFITHAAANPFVAPPSTLSSTTLIPRGGAALPRSARRPRPCTCSASPRDADNDDETAHQKILPRSQRWPRLRRRNAAAPPPADPDTNGRDTDTDYSRPSSSQQEKENARRASSSHAHAHAHTAPRSSDSDSLADSAAPPPASNASPARARDSFFSPRNRWFSPSSAPTPPSPAPGAGSAPPAAGATPSSSSQEAPHLSLLSTPYYATKQYTKAHKYNMTRPLTSLLAMAVGFTVFPALAGVFQPLTVSSGSGGVEQLDVLITGTFTPVVGILFAMLASTAVSSLRQRQQDLRDLLNQELALIRMLLVMIKDASIIRLLLDYTLQLENETFAYRENGISYEHERPGTDQAIRREEIFAESEETLWHCVQEANDLRLRAEVEATIRSLVVFRTKRRAVLDSGLPQIHFIITALLGVCMVAAFCLVATADLRLFEMTTARLLFGGLLALLSLTYTLLRDLRDPFGGDYGVAPWRLYRTVELLRDRLGMPMQ